MLQLTHPCLSTLFGLFFDCRLSKDFAVYRLFCSSAEDELFVGDVITKSPVLFHRFARPVGLPMPPLLCDITLDGMTLLFIVLPLLICMGAAVECTVAGRGSGEGAGDVLLCESAEWSDPFDWWCNERRFRFDTFVDAWNLEGEFVVVVPLLLLLLLRLRRQSSNVVVTCVERTEIITKFIIISATWLLFYNQNLLKCDVGLYANL